MRFLTLVVCLAHFQLASAWLPFGNHEEEVVLDPIIQANEGIEESCVQAGLTGNCAFYTCLERRFPCFNSNDYSIGIGLHFCNKIDQAYADFDDFGRLWLNKTSICLLSYLLPIYRSESTTCAAIQEAGILGIKTCNNHTIDGNRGFCDFLQTNGVQYKKIMGRNEMRLLGSLNDYGIWQSMVERAAECLPDVISRTFQRMATSIRNWLTSVSQTVRSWFNFN